MSMQMNNKQKYVEQNYLKIRISTYIQILIKLHIRKNLIIHTHHADDNQCCYLPKNCNFYSFPLNRDKMN